jgi:transposase-like protein
MAGQRGEVIIRFKGAHYMRDIILTDVQWYVAYPLTYFHVEEWMQEQGVILNHATVRVLPYCSESRRVYCIGAL